MIDRDFADLPAAAAPVARDLAMAIHTGQRLILVGPPGVGKMMLAQRAAGLLTLTDHARRWIAAEFDAIGLATDRATFGRGAYYSGPPPVRAPHHTISDAAMSGTWSRKHPVGCMTITTPRCVCGLATRERDAGHRVSRAGEVTLARFGILILDEITEFRRDALRATNDRLRAMGATAPIVIGTAAPCPCGWRGALAHPCVCSEGMISRFEARRRELAALVGITVTIGVPAVGVRDLRDARRCPSTAELRREIAQGVTELEIPPGVLA